MNGKSKCKILKDIRRQIAKENDIDLVISECRYQGDCTGTCPKCESEVRYLEQELRKRQQMGKAIAVAGIAAALVVSTVGCADSHAGVDPLSQTSSSQLETTAGELPIPGMIEWQPETTAPDEPLMGVPAEQPETSIPNEELMGDPVPNASGE